MKEINELAFEAAVEIVASTMEETDVELSAKGGGKVSDYFEAIYKRLAAITEKKDEAAGAGTFEVFQDAKGEYRFRLKAANGQIIASSEGYKKKSSCLDGISSVQRNAGCAIIKEV